MQTWDLVEVEDLSQKSKIDFEDYVTAFSEQIKLMNEWVIVKKDKSEEFFKDHEKILVNMFYNQFYIRNK